MQRVEHNMWLAVNKDDEFIVFKYKPEKIKVYEQVESPTEVEFTPYGDFPKMVDGEKYEERWAYKNYNGEYVYGTSINPSFLAIHLQDLTWDDQPVNISK